MKNRNELIEKVADVRTEEVDMDSLVQYFRDGQIDFLEAMTDSELEEHLHEFGLEWLLED